MAYLYVMKNLLMPGYCKIGVSENVEERAKELYGSWEIVKAWEMEMKIARERELAIKRKMREFIALGHELFNCPIEYLVDRVENATEQPPEAVIPDGAITTEASAGEIGKLMRLARKRQGLTIMEFSGLANVGYRFVSELENGKQTCQIGKALATLNALGIKLYLHLP